MTYYRYPNGEVYNFSHTPSSSDAQRLTNAEGERARREYCRAELVKMLKPGDTVYCVLQRKSASGMSRDISLYLIEPGKPEESQAIRDNQPRMRNIDAYAADLLGRKLGKREGILCGGAGMDMGFALVYALGRAMWPDGTSEPHGRRNGEPDSEGGYALRHSWL